MIVIGLVIGMGIFRTATTSAQAALTPGVYFAAWIAGGIIALCGLKRTNELRFDAAMSTAMLLFADGAGASGSFADIARDAVKQFCRILPSEAIIKAVGSQWAREGGANA